MLTVILKGNYLFWCLKSTQCLIQKLGGRWCRVVGAEACTEKEGAQIGVGINCTQYVRRKDALCLFFCCDAVRLYDDVLHYLLNHESNGPYCSDRRAVGILGFDSFSNGRYANEQPHLLRRAVMGQGHRPFDESDLLLPPPSSRGLCSNALAHPSCSPLLEEEEEDRSHFTPPGNDLPESK